MEEEFRDVVGYEDYFQISNLGKLYSKRSSRILKQTKSKTGYLSISTRIGGRAGKAICLKIHRLVAEAFLEQPTEEQVLWAKSTKYGKVLVNHKDGNKSNNSVENLEWVTNSENLLHAISIGLVTSEKNSVHGTPTQYRYGCRCEECKQAYSKERRLRYLKNRN